MLLECCGCAAQIAKCNCVHEVATSGIDLEIARLVCDTIVCVLLIFVLGALAWRLIDHHATKKVTIRKRRWDFADKNLALKQDLQEKLLSFQQQRCAEYKVNEKGEKIDKDKNVLKVDADAVKEYETLLKALLYPKSEEPKKK